MQEKDLKQDNAEMNQQAAEAEAETAQDTQAEESVGEAKTEESGQETEASEAVETAAETESKQITELKDKYARLYAEFDNYRKRTDKEKSQMYDMGAKKVIEKILPVVDNFERALQSIPEDVKDSAFTDGVDRIYKQLMKTFEEIEVKPIEAVGAKFDPNLHNAVMTETEGDAEEDSVTEDLLKGYTYKGDVVRHSMVKVKK